MEIHENLKLTPRAIVEELDRYIIGQEKAKRAVAIALRNRWRRQQVEPSLRDEILPKNIIMIGPTGVGKTEIARRLSKLTQAPFVKVEASKFTEVGYVGRDVDSMIRDLMEVGVNLVRAEERERVKEKARQSAEERVLDLLVPPLAPRPQEDDAGAAEERATATREKFRKLLRSGSLNDRTVEIDVSDTAMPFMEIFTPGGMEEMGLNLKDMFGGMGGRTRRRKVSVPEALELIAAEEAQKLIDMDKVVKEAVARVENHGIVFLDEIDKIAGREGGRGPDVSREGVQRDLLPVIEGSTVTTKHGPVRTDHILFIASGAFHVARVSDLIPELQGRFPIRVELTSLDEEQFYRILTEPQNALLKQYCALMATEGVVLQFEDSAVHRIASMAAEINRTHENIGARRLHTVLEALLEDLSFDASERAGQTVVLTDRTVDERLGPVMANEDLNKYIL